MISDKFIKNNLRVKSISVDFIINIAASLIYTFARQLVVFPLLALHISEVDYGMLLTIAGLANVCTALVGGSLNNIKLIKNNLYEEHNLKGDFILYCNIGAVAIILYSITLWAVFKYRFLTFLLLTSYMLVSSLYQYGTAFFRLELNFKRILIANILVSTVYILSTFVFSTKILWPMIFLLGELLGLIYVIKTTRFIYEPFQKTPLFYKVGKEIIMFALMNFIGTILMYADRMIIYPTLGSANVSYYSVASFFGKSASMVMVPISGVLLGYFSQKKFNGTKKLFTLINAISIICLVLFGCVCYLVAPWFTELLYPTLYAQAADYIFLATIGSIIFIAGNMSQPMVLRCCPTVLSLFIQLLYGVSYLCISLPLMKNYGLYGFCYASILANTIRLVSLYLVGYWKL